MGVCFIHPTLGILQPRPQVLSSPERKTLVESGYAPPLGGNK